MLWLASTFYQLIIHKHCHLTKITQCDFICIKLRLTNRSFTFQEIRSGISFAKIFHNLFWKGYNKYVAISKLFYRITLVKESIIAETLSCFDQIFTTKETERRNRLLYHTLNIIRMVVGFTYSTLSSRDTHCFVHRRIAELIFINLLTSFHICSTSACQEYSV